MIDRTFLLPPEEDGSRYWAKIMERLKATREELAKDPNLIKFCCLVNQECEEAVSHNQIVDHIEADKTWDGIWKFQKILDHEGPLKPNDP